MKSPMKIFFITAAIALAAATAAAQAVPAQQSGVPSTIQPAGFPAGFPAVAQQQQVPTAASIADSAAQSYSQIFPETRPDTDKIGTSRWAAYTAYGVLAALAACVVAYIILRRKTPPKTPYEIAKEAVEQAKSDSAQLDAKQYASQISFAVRAYIEAEHDIPAPKRTTQEFLLAASHRTDFDKTARQTLEKILEISDAAKFARSEFESAQRDELADAAEKFLDSDKIAIDIKNGRKIPQTRRAGNPAPETEQTK